MKRLLSLGRFGRAALMVVAVGIGGCASSQPSVDDEEEVAEDSAALEDSAAPEARDEARGGPDRRRGHGPGMRGRGGPEMFLFHAAEELDLTDAQQTAIDEARESLRPDGADHGPKPEQIAQLAAAVRKGAVDAKALAPADGADPMKAHRAKVVAGIQKLHDTLTPAQRKELVASIQSKMADFADRDPPPAGDRGAKMRGHEGGKSPTGFLLHGIDVSDSQRAKIDAALAKAGLAGPPEDMPSPADFAAMRAKHEAALAAFAQDAFDASTALPEPPAGMGSAGKANRGPKRFLESLAVIVPLLDAGQREALAQRIEAGPPDHVDRKGPRGAGLRGPGRGE